MPYKLSFDDNVKDARPIAFVTGGEHIISRRRKTQ